jgi:hypothetical protein
MAARTKAERQRRRLEATAYHEAGHAVMALELRRRFKHVTVVPKDDSLGHVLKTDAPDWFRPDCPGFGDELKTERWIERELLIGPAGVAAEGRFLGRRNQRGASSDYRTAINLGSYIYCDPTLLGKYLEFMIERVRVLVAQPANWIRIEALARELIEWGHLSYRQAREVCRRAFLDRVRFDRLSAEMVARLEAECLDDDEAEEPRPMRRTKRA